MLRYAITDRRRLGMTEAEQSDALVEQAARLAARGDIDFLQLREKDLPPAALAALARRILDALHTHAPGRTQRMQLLINARADVAIAVGADGVHLTSSPGELTPTQVRQLYKEASLPTPTISVSCHSLDDIARITDFAPDLILFGPVFEKRVAQPGDPDSADQLVSEGTGLELLKQASAAAAPVPVLALGGVTAEAAASCLDAGAAGVAGIRLFLWSREYI